MTQEQADRIERKLDLIINTFGLKAALKAESIHKVKVLANTPVEDVKAYMQAQLRQARRTR